MDTLTRFIGSEIATAIVAAVEALPRTTEIVTFKAGENMPITAGLVFHEGMSNDENELLGWIPEFAWNGEKWEEIGYL